jgi:DNA polymerase-3 subunit gamma/tau
MSYTVLARKYRSEGFDDVVGQDHVAKTLKRAIESGRVAHAYLFCGTRGVGKTSMARILAKALNCEKSKSPTPTPCGKCNSCAAIARGDDMDVIEIDAASNTQVEKTREMVIENAAYRPARSRYKIYIIDEAHMLSKASFNALLKTLEEPPEHVKFILATTEAEKILPTILSRCQRYDFRSIPTREIAGHLQNICKEEKIKADEDALMLIAKAGAGSMRDALSLLDRLLSVGEKTLTVEMIEQMLGMPKSQIVFDLVQSLGEGNVKQVLQKSDALVTVGLSPDTLIASLSDHLRNLLIIRACGAKSELVEVPGLSIEELEKQAEQFDAVTLSQDIAVLEELRRTLRSTQSGRALFDATLVRLALAEQFASVNALLGRIDGNATAAPSPALKKNSEMTPAQATGFQPAQGAENGLKARAADEAVSGVSNIEPVAMDDLPAVWQAMLQVLSSKGAAFLSLIESATLASIEDNVAVLRYPSECDTIVKMLDRNGKKDAIRNALSAILKCDIGVRLEVAPPAPEIVRARPVSASTAERRAVERRSTPVPPPEPPARITAEMRSELRKHPLVSAVIEHLGGEIVKVE